ncbi:hypothetical protein [Streptomyces griseorubiginosus]|uniref:hypothetical protein n=1 Tax=Streptomyces griseorubiginosus TaxID=67304 RepID=UPI00076BC0C6|nr:hypothetical protein [Streptomyces griseorubiginosus]KUM68580.1 hypothetical protein AQI84_36655 [Streptomyces griseorubiginosus]
MASDDEILDSIRRDSTLAELLWRVCEFDLSRGDHGEPVQLSSGVSLEAVAGDFTGGTFFLCGDRGSERPVLYASSEGQSGLIGRSLTEALEIMIGLPSWWDCLKFSGSGDLEVMRATAANLERDEIRDEPELHADRARVAKALHLERESLSFLVTRLHAAVSATAPDFLLTVETGEEYDPLFGPWLPSHNPAWR